jgi:hypothetical protein
MRGCQVQRACLGYHRLGWAIRLGYMVEVWFPN